MTRSWAAGYDRKQRHLAVVGKQRQTALFVTAPAGCSRYVNVFWDFGRPALDSPEVMKLPPCPDCHDLDAWGMG